jgi:septin family protein
MRYLNVEDADSFKRTLQSGFYFSYRGKIMMVGTECVGKSAIVSTIMGKRPPKTRQSTEGIDVHVCRATVDMETNKLIPKGTD